MATIEMSIEELNFLIDKMEAWLDELEAEIAHTDKAQFRASLKEDRARAQSLLNKLLECSQVSTAV